MSSLTQLRGRITALGGVIVLILVAGIWIAMTHASAQESAGGASHGKSAAGASSSTQAPVGPLRLVSVTPASDATGVNGAADIKVQFSAPLAAGSPLPTIKPRIPGGWQGAGTGSLVFVPTAAFRQYTRVTVKIPGGPLGVRSASGGLLVRTKEIHFKTGGFRAARLDQLLAQLGYLPLTWTAAPGVSVPAATDALGQVTAAYSPPQGSFSWQPGYPSQLRAFWQGGASSSLIIKGAVMAFESDHGILMDGVAGSQVWKSLLKAVATNQLNTSGYTYAIAREANPETLTIWHNGRKVLHVLANTGISVAPTTLGTSPVYVRFRNQIMRGTNPDGSHYADPVQYVAYFRAGEAVHYFPRGSYGYPQSLGCVELDLNDAARAWPYLTYGSLVTVARGALTPASSPVAN
ncbi:MAG: L,D-transpeptidase family protein [Streptosporangiaceae bacterium]